MDTKNKILIVDDDEDLGFLMKDFFNKKGHLVFIAATLHDGLTLMEEQYPHYIFLDNHLPDGLGWSNATWVLEKYPQTRLILTSAMQIPPTSATTFSIIYKPLLMKELNRMFP